MKVLQGLAHPLSLVLTLTGCGDSHRSARPERDAGMSGPSPTYTMQGVYRCCGEGLGESCCDGIPKGTCFAFGGVGERCAEEGEEVDAKDICAVCCDKLSRVPATRRGTSVAPALDGLVEGCDPSPIPSLFVCLACGDGLCGVGETLCNCPEDCD